MKLFFVLFVSAPFVAIICNLIYFILKMCL